MVDTTSLANRSRRPRKTRTIHRRTPSNHRASHKREMRRKPSRGANTVSRARTQRQENSLKAYTEKIEPELEGLQKEVYTALKEIGPATMHEVADHLDKRLNQVSGRFGPNELLHTQIEVTGKRDGRSIYKVKQ